MRQLRMPLENSYLVSLNGTVVRDRGARHAKS